MTQNVMRNNDNLKSARNKVVDSICCIVREFYKTADLSGTAYADLNKILGNLQSIKARLDRILEEQIDNEDYSVECIKIEEVQ